MVAYVSKLAAKTAPHFGRLNLSNLLSYTPNLAIWGGASFAGIFVFTEGWPLFQDTFFKKLPVFGSHWVKEVAPEDSPQ
ncbi:LADA_0G11562g1_1 [Lachancea dasiensis]|uniref:LADA_0G11562g1_1 n=1 Tax=Lachancea dasiensis TaxID=1072105 RepID=A0A1G4JVF8_9SACH|nr:LADA_0G11562g1_1 [Lachancea dasiensis]